MRRWIQQARTGAATSYRKELAEVDGRQWLAVVRCAYFLAWTTVALAVRVLVWIALWGAGRTLPWQRLQQGYSDHEHFLDLNIPDDAEAGVLDDLIAYSQGALDRAHARRDFIMGKAAQVLVLDGAVFVILGLGGSGAGRLRIAAAVFALVSVLLTARAFGPLWWSEPRLEPSDLAKNLKKVIVDSQLAAARRTTQTIDVLTDVVAAAVNWGAVAVLFAGMAVLVPTKQGTEDESRAHAPREPAHELDQRAAALSEEAPQPSTSTPSATAPVAAPEAPIAPPTIETNGQGTQPQIEIAPNSPPAGEVSGPPASAPPPDARGISPTNQSEPAAPKHAPKEATEAPSVEPTDERPTNVEHPGPPD